MFTGNAIKLVEGRELPFVGGRGVRDANDERTFVNQSNRGAYEAHKGIWRGYCSLGNVMDRKEWDYRVGMRSAGRKQRVIGR